MYEWGRYLFLGQRKRRIAFARTMAHTNGTQYVLRESNYCAQNNWTIDRVRVVVRAHEIVIYISFVPNIGGIFLLRRCLINPSVISVANVPISMHSAITISEMHRIAVASEIPSHQVVSSNERKIKSSFSSPMSWSRSILVLSLAKVNRNGHRSSAVEQ